eukprot:gene14386-19307_t
MKLSLSPYSIGCSSFGNVFGFISDDDIITLVSYALKNKYNYFDVAPWYGNRLAEKRLGNALSTLSSPNSSSKFYRENYFVSTKVGSRYGENTDEERIFDYSYNATILSVNRSLQLMQLDYIDIVFVHDIEFAPSLDYIMKETIPALLSLKGEGKIRFIGISGYPLSLLLLMIELDNNHDNLNANHTIDFVLSYSRLTLHDQLLLQYKSLFDLYDVQIINAAPLSMGLLSNSPPPWHPAYADNNHQSDLAVACKEANKYCQENQISIEKLALHYSISTLMNLHHKNTENTDNISSNNLITTITSTKTIDELTKNLDSIMNGLSEHELKIRNEIIQKYFKNLTNNNNNWEGVELSTFIPNHKVYS